MFLLKNVICQFYFKKGLENVLKKKQLRFHFFFKKFHQKSVSSEIMKSIATIPDNQQKIHVPKVKTAVYHNSFKYKGTLLWNFISDQINYNCSLAAYKHQLKLYLLKNYIIVK